MAFKIQREVLWRAGEGTPVKYRLGVDLSCEMTNITESAATFSLTGTVTVSNHPNNSQNSWPASDFAVMTLGGFDPYNYPFTAGTSYYQTPLPAVPNAPQSYVDAIQLEFRGDTAAPNPNRSSLYIKGQGVVLNANSSESTNTFNVNNTFTIQLNGSPTQEVLIWSASGADSSTRYNWLERQVWATMVDFDYRPGMTWNGSAYMSHNRSGGVCNVWNGSSWKEMRTEGAPSAKGNPPLIFRGNDWFNQAKIGQGG